MFEYLWSVWRAIQLGMRLSPDTVQIVETHPNAIWIAFGVVMVAGISLLLGQSVILFMNQVSPGRFAISLISNGIWLVVGWLFWAITVWVIGNELFSQDVPLRIMLALIGLSYAPFVFGFLILMPYLGPFVQRVLYVWSFIIALRSVEYLFRVGFVQALVCVGIGWLLLMLMSSTIGRPIVALRNWIWHAITKTSINTPLQEKLREFALEHSKPVKPNGEES